MKRAIGIAAFILFFAVPAHAQGKGASVAMGSSSTGASYNGGSGGGGGYSGGGGTVSHHNYPRAQFAVGAVSGSQEDFVPSSYLPFDRAVAEGQAALDAAAKSPAQTAEATSNAPRPHAKVTFVQDANGDPILVRQ
jgi:hypothetical protein